MNVAQLKQLGSHVAGRQEGWFPRLNERGSIEARLVFIPTVIIANVSTFE